jgi:pimeloyl-ACP methyl ester carboxylesterase
MLKAAILATSPSQPVTLVAHDWGAAAAVWLATKHPTLINSLVLLDVGIMTPAKMSIKQVLVVLAYQWWLTLAFIVSQFLSTTIGDVLIGVFPWKLIGPTPYETKLPRRQREIHSWMCYPYYHTWSRILVKNKIIMILINNAHAG